jgi:hypothetical protein
VASGKAPPGLKRCLIKPAVPVYVSAARRGDPSRCYVHQQPDAAVAVGPAPDQILAVERRHADAGLHAMAFGQVFEPDHDAFVNETWPASDAEIWPPSRLMDIRSGRLHILDAGGGRLLSGRVTNLGVPTHLVTAVHHPTLSGFCSAVSARSRARCAMEWVIHVECGLAGVDLQVNRGGVAALAFCGA